MCLLRLGVQRKVSLPLNLCIAKRNVNSKHSLIQRKNNRLKKRLLFQPSESSLCADKLIVCFTPCEQWGSLSGLPGHMHFITRHLDDKRNQGESEPRDDSRLWLHFCDSSLEESLVLTGTLVTQWKGSQPCAWSLTHFPRDGFPLDSVESYLNFLTCSYLNFSQTVQSKPPWMEWLSQYTK